MRPERHALRSYGPPIAWALLLFVQSSIPDFDAPIHISRWDDKIGHLLLYLPLGYLLCQSLIASRPNGHHASLVLLTILLGSVYGVTDELHQYFVPGRFADWRDAVADGIGVVVGSFVYLRIKNRMNNKRPASNRNTRREM